MAGHSQFKNIMHRKGRQDKVRSKLFGKLAREITVSAKIGMPDPAFNPRLRAAILAARAENMPKDNIERAIKKASGNDAESYDEIRYEGYGPGGVAGMFNHVGVVEFAAKAASADAMLDAAIEAGAEDGASNEDGHQIFPTPESLREMAKALEVKFGEPRKAALLWKPQNTVALDDEAGEKMLKLIELLDDNEDVQNVYANFEVSDALVAKMSA